MTRYQAVLFDLDGTLRLPDPGPVEAFLLFLQRQGVAVNPLRERAIRIWTHQFWSQDKLLAQQMTAGDGRFWSDYSRLQLEQAGVTQGLGQMAEALRHFFENEYSPLVRAAPGARELLLSLRARGFQLAVISNRSEPFTLALEGLGLGQLFDYALAAGEVGSWKPNPNIFRHALTAMGNLSANDCIYIGDNYFADGHGAFAAGLTPIIFDPNDLYGRDAYQCIRALTDLDAFL